MVCTQTRWSYRCGRRSAGQSVVGKLGSIPARCPGGGFIAAASAGEAHSSVCLIKSPTNPVPAPALGWATQHWRDRHATRGVTVRKLSLLDKSSGDALGMLEIRLLGEQRVTGGPEVGGRTSSSRSVALLTYLILHAEVPQTRHHLAGVFWPDSSES